MKLDKDTLAMFGMASLLPGMQHMHDVLTEVLNEHRALLQSMQQNGPTIEAPKKRGRPKEPLETLAVQSGVPVEEIRQLEAATATVKESRKGKPNPGQAAYWAAMTPEEKRAEVKRRMMARVSGTLEERYADTATHVDGQLTLAGAARELKLTVSGVKNITARLGLRLARAKNPKGKGVMCVLTAVQFERVRKLHEKTSPTGEDGHRLHPRDARHPGHAEYRKKLAAAGRARFAKAVTA